MNLVAELGYILHHANPANTRIIVTPEALTITPAWAAVFLTTVTSTILASLWIGRQIYASKGELQTQRDECAQRHADSKASVDAMDKMLRAEFAGQIAESNREVMREFRELGRKVEKLLIRTAVLQDRSSHSDDAGSDETRLPV